MSESEQTALTNEELRARIAELETALRFYADPETYSEYITLDIMPIADDCGIKARAALGLPEPVEDEAPSDDEAGYW